MDSSIARRSLSPSSGNQGKAVGIGHSCAAVTHHRPTTAPPRARAKPIGALTPVKARGEEKPVWPAFGPTGDTCGVRTPGPEKSFDRSDCARRLRKLHRNSEE